MAQTSTSTLHKLNNFLQVPKRSLLPRCLSPSRKPNLKDVHDGHDCGQTSFPTLLTSHAASGKHQAGDSTVVDLLPEDGRESKLAVEGSLLDAKNHQQTSRCGGHNPRPSAHASIEINDLEVPCIGPDQGRLPMLHGGYQWIRSGNGHEERMIRKEAAMATLAACKHGKYMLEGSCVRLRRLRMMLSSTRIFRASDATDFSCIYDGSRTACVQHDPSDTLLDVATACARAGRKVAVVNASSGYHVGGAFQTGGRHALEETLNIQSTLFQSLAVAQELAVHQGVQAPRCVNPTVTRFGDAWTCYIPEDGVILSPNVEVFREDGSVGYPFMRSPVELAAVLSVAMPNFNARVFDAPCDYPGTEQEYNDLIEKKFIALLGAAALAGIEVLIMPPVGCGVYQNKADKVGHIFGSVLYRRFPGVFKEVHLLGNTDFIAAAGAAADGR